MNSTIQMKKGVRVWVRSHVISNTEEIVREQPEIRASFLDIIGETLRLNHCDLEDPNMLLTMPVKWVIEFRTLVDIIFDKSKSAKISKLPHELVLFINEFI